MTMSNEEILYPLGFKLVGNPEALIEEESEEGENDEEEEEEVDEGGEVGK